MHSAMIDRAEFPVQRKSTLRGSLLLTSSMGAFLTCYVTQDNTLRRMRCRSAAQISGLPWQQSSTRKDKRVACTLEIHRIDDGAAVLSRRDELGAGEHGDMKRQRVGGNPKRPRDVAGCHALGAALHQQAKNLKAAFLRKRAEGVDGR